MHRSVSNEASQSAVKFSAPFRNGGKINNERLEFLGDSILGAVCATLLYGTFQDKAEGDLAKIKAVVVSEEILSKIALDLNIDRMLLLGKGEEKTSGRTKKAILADAMEALIGALYLDSGYKTAFNFVSRCIEPEIKKSTGADYYKDYKSILQEHCQRQFRCYPEYCMVKRTGPEHNRTFHMEVRIGEEIYGTGNGHNKKSAEQEAAKAAWERINDTDNRGESFS